MHKDSPLFETTLKSLSAQDFLKLGMDQIAYVKPRTVNGQTVFVIHAADGTALSALPNEGVAHDAIQHNNLETVTVH